MKSDIKDYKNKIYIAQNSVIGDVISRREKNTLSIDGYILTQKDILIFTCQACNKETSQRFLYTKRFLEKNFICKACAREQTNLKRYGVKHALQNKQILNNVKDKMHRLYGGYALGSVEILNNVKKTNVEKYGVENVFQDGNVKEKIKQVVLKKYGVNHISQAKEIKDKIKQTNVKKFGFESHNSSPEVKNKKEKTHLLRHGVKNPNQAYEVKQKKKNNNMLKYGVSHPLQHEPFLNKLKETKNKNFFNMLKDGARLNNKVEPLFNYSDILNHKKYDDFSWKCKACGTKFEDNFANGKIPRCPTCYPYKRSREEQAIFNWLISLNIKNIYQNLRNIISPYEIDIYLPDYRLAIEFNGAYWHSTEFIHDKYYHQNKVKLCNNNEIRLLHIWEDEWNNNKENIKLKIIEYMKNVDKKIIPKEPALRNIMEYKIWV